MSFLDDNTQRDPQLVQLVHAIASSSLISDNSVSLQSSIDSSSLKVTAGLDDAESIEQLGPIIKQISETNKQEAFLDQLDGFIRKKDGEIERMCNANYQEFVHSVDQLLKVRQGSLQLKRNIANLNTALRKTGTEVADKKQELLEVRKVQYNLEKTMDSIQDSLIVLELAESVRLKIENGKYYAALKILDRLQTQHLRNVSQYSFAKYLEESIPVMQDMIKDSVNAQLKEWLYKLRGTSRKIGMLAMKYMQERQDRWRQRTAENPKLKSLQHHNVNSAIEMAVNEGNESNILDEVNIDFEPLYRCIHVYNTLGLQQEFQNSYEEDRRAQANLALTIPLNLQDGNMDSFETLLQDIVGFFIIEHVIMHSTTDFRSQAEVDALWEMVTTKVIAVISNSLRGCRDPELFLKIKYSLLIFNQTLEGFNYPVKQLHETLLALFQRYSELLINQYSEVFERIVQEDECMPMTVANQEELEEVMQFTRYQPDRDTIKRNGFPFTLPFSKVFPTCCRDVSIFVHQFYQFAEGFSQTHGEMDDILKKAVDSLLISKVNAILLKKLESTNLSQIVQIIINIEYFESTCPDFEMLLMETRSFHRAGPIQLRATSTFKETRQTAEKRIFRVVNLKLDEFLELSEYDWMAQERQDHPSPYLFDLVTFLTNVINAALLNLPESIKSLIYFDALDHLSHAMMDLLLDHNEPALTDIALQNFDVDVRFLEDFVKNLGDPTIVDTFLELRQLLTLVQSDNAEEFLNPQMKNKKYSRVQPQHAVIVMEKLMRDIPTTNLPTVREKMRRRAMENVVRVTRTLHM
ncbi:unnamed protein product [Umbelopsis sp. WA50703]